MRTIATGATPLTHGVGIDQSFYSLNSQAGRPAVLAFIGRLNVAEARSALAALHERAALFESFGVDLVAFVEIETPQAAAWLNALPPSLRLVFSHPDVFAAWAFRHVEPKFAALDASGRIIAGPRAGSPDAVEALLAAIAALPREEPFDDCCPAPVLVVPDIVSPDLCRELIAHFEASETQFGGMASVDASGAFRHKVDGGKKHRYDLVLGPTDRYLNVLLAGVAARVIPEVAKAFHVDIGHTDRMLLARYDETGGYFRRHRDNAAPAVAFRQFALSINLNDDYDGGYVQFPEYNLRRYRPRAGAGVVFSCSLLHEAAGVTRGRRYCALTFLHDAAAQARWLEGQRLAS